MMDQTSVRLPGGWWDPAGRLQRDAELTVLTGRDEEQLARPGRQETASLVTQVLSQCVRRVGDLSPVPADVIRQLLVADRDYLLLRLRQATFGDRIRADLFCPWAQCGERMSVDFSIDELPVRESAEKGPVYEMMLSPMALADSAGAGDLGGGEVAFRLPTGADQEELSGLLASDEPHALTLLLARCVERLGGRPAPGANAMAALSGLARAEIEAEMLRVAPMVQREIETTCAECHRTFTAPVNLRRFFFGELRTDNELLYKEVHYLAYHYHWSEAEIMAMTRTKRARYLDVLSGEIERINGASLRLPAAGARRRHPSFPVPGRHSRTARRAGRPGVAETASASSPARAQLPAIGLGRPDRAARRHRRRGLGAAGLACPERPSRRPARRRARESPG